MIRTASLFKTLICSSLLAGGALTLAHAAELSAVPSGAYESDPTHAYLTFQYNHLGLSNPRLSFDDFIVDLELDNEDVAKSTLSVVIDPASLDAGSEVWKGHLTSADWFDVESHPEITFQSTAIEAAGDGAYKVTGDLTIKGETSPATLNVAINAAMNHPMSGNPVIGLDASGSVMRSDYGLDKFAPNVSDEVQIDISVELEKTGG